MKKAGGIIAIIAGIFGIFAALATLTIGGLGAAFEAKNATTVVYLGWGGVGFSFLTIVLGAICISATSKLPGILLIMCAIAGAILGGTLVALFMVLALVGGVLALFGKNPQGVMPQHLAIYPGQPHSLPLYPVGQHPNQQYGYSENRMPPYYGGPQQPPQPMGHPHQQQHGPQHYGVPQQQPPRRNGNPSTP